jgi:peptidoglycan hydrolase-like protein with peptidoglycan-binding domain
MSDRPRFRRLLRAAILVAVVIALAAGAVLAGLWKPWTDAAQASSQEAAPQAVTVGVERGTLTSRLRLNAALGYGDPISLPAATGVITALPAPGKVIRIGARVYEVDGHPVVLMKGARPLWRDLARGISDGKDVLQLERNLARLGFFDREPDTRFDWRTTQAVRRWQKDLGVPVTGTVAAAEVVMVDAPGIRISQVTAQLGQRDASPLTYTATTLRAVAKLTAAQARELQAGTPVSVVLPDGTELDSTLAAVDPGGQPTEEDGQTTPPTAVIDFPDQRQVAAVGPAAVRVIVQDEQERAETLIVPVTALVATARDGYAVEVQTADGIVRTPVRIGLVADARVQILASGSEVDGAPGDAPSLAEGDAVVTSR